MPDFFAGVTINNVRNINYLATQTRHAKRTGPGIELRPGAVPGTQLLWSLFEDDPRDYVSAFKKHKDITKGRERGGAQIALHMLLHVSPEWLDATGGRHDLNNPRIVALFETAVQSARKRYGGVFAARLDMDEVGSAVVDVFCAPVHERQGRPKKNGSRGTITLEISPRKSLKALQNVYGTKKDFEAVQSAWADDVRVLDPEIKRGVSKTVTGRVHLDTPAYKAARDAERAALEVQKAALDTAKAAEAERVAIEADVRVAKEELKQTRETQAEALEGVATQERALVRSAFQIASEERRLEERLRDLKQRAAAQQAEVERTTADTQRVRAREIELSQWHADLEHTAKLLKVQAKDNEKRLRDVERHETELRAGLLAIAMRQRAVEAQETESARRSAASESLFEKGRRESERLASAERERVRALNDVRDRDESLAAIYGGLTRIRAGMPSSAEFEQGVISPDARKCLKLVADTVTSIKQADAHTTAQAEMRAQALEERALAAEEKVERFRTIIRSLRTATVELVNVLARYKLTGEVSEKLTNVRGVIATLFGMKNRETRTLERDAKGRLD